MNPPAEYTCESGTVYMYRKCSECARAPVHRHLKACGSGTAPFCPPWVMMVPAYLPFPGEPLLPLGPTQRRCPRLGAHASNGCARSKLVLHRTRWLALPHPAVATTALARPELTIGPPPTGPFDLGPRRGGPPTAA